MAIKSDNTHGNPYHDESNGRFTTKNGGNLETIDDFLSSFDSIDDFIDSIPTESKNVVLDFRGTLSKQLLNSKNREKIIFTLNEQLNKLPDNYKKIMFDFFNKTKIPLEIKGQATQFVTKSVGWFDIPKYLIRVKQSDIFDTKEHEEGTSLVHETFHAIDKMTNNGQWMSTTKVLSNGKTLQRILTEDIQSIDRNKLFQELLDDHNSKLSELVALKLNGKITPERVKELEDIQAQNRSERNKELAYVNKLHNKHYFSSYLDYIAAFDEVEKKYKKLLEPYSADIDMIREVRKQSLAEIRHDYTLMSDICQSIRFHNPFTEYMGYGHSMGYWNNPKNQVIEFFAECAESESLNPRAFALFEKYFPNAVAGYRELLKGIEGGN